MTEQLLEQRAIYRGVDTETDTIIVEINGHEAYLDTAAMMPHIKPAETRQRLIREAASSAIIDTVIIESRQRLIIYSKNATAHFLTERCFSEINGQLSFPT